MRIFFITITVAVMLLALPGISFAAQYQCYCNDGGATEVKHGNPAEFTTKSACDSTCRTSCASTTNPNGECRLVSSGSNTTTSNSGNNNSGSSGGLQNPLKTDDIPTLIGGFIKGALGVVGSIALVIFIYGGFMYLTAGGSSERVSKGKQTLVWASIGLVVIFTSYALLNFIFGALL